MRGKGQLFHERIVEPGKRQNCGSNTVLKLCLGDIGAGLAAVSFCKQPERYPSIDVDL